MSSFIFTMSPFHDLGPPTRRVEEFAARLPIAIWRRARVLPITELRLAKAIA